MSAIMPVALALRFFLELCALAALGYWGWQAGQTPVVKFALGIGAPLMAAILWGLFVAPKATIAAPSGVRLLIELAVFGLAVLALFVAGRPQLALALAIAYVIHRVLLFIANQ